jgi:uncharacterized protein YndB with AHSA1/START domain
MGSLNATITVPVPPERAFAAFTDGIDEWWVREFTWSGPEALDRIGIEPRLGGMAYEIGPDGFRLDWGRVVTWQPPEHLAFTWQIGPDRVPVPDPAHASEVDVRFTAEDGGTRVDLEHRGFERHGPDGEGYREALTAGWNELLARYAAAAKGG